MTHTAASVRSDFGRPDVRAGMTRDRRRAGIRARWSRRRDQSIIVAATAAILLLFPSLSGGQESGKEEPSTGCAQKNLISITPPIVGYTSVEGTIYDAFPVSVERAVQERIRLPLKPSLIHFDSAFQSSSLFLSCPSISNHALLYRSYHGFMRTASGLHGGRLPVRTEVLRGGSRRYLWPVGSDKQFTLGLCMSSVPWTTSGKLRFYDLLRILVLTTLISRADAGYAASFLISRWRRGKTIVGVTLDVMTKLSAFASKVK